MMATPLCPSNRNPVANPLEVLQSDSAPRVLGVRHYLFGDAVVLIRGKALFFATTLLEQALSRFGAFLLQPLAQFGLTSADH